MWKNKKFISIIWWYHKQIFTFEAEQNYHMMPVQVMKDQGYECEIFSIDSQVKIEDDPNFIEWVKVIYYKNISWYLYYLWNNRKSIIYSNSLTIKTLLVWMIWKRTVFIPHDNIFWRTWKNIFKKYLIIFFYSFYTKIRVNNGDELLEIENIKKWLWCICPLNISNKFLNKNLNWRNWATFIWNLTFAKNPEFLIETCKILKNKNIDFQINVIWEDRYNKNGKTFLKVIRDYWLEDYITILWFKNHREIKDILSKSLIYINTSIWEWQCLAVYEWALAWNILCLQNIMSFPSVFNDNAFYHDTPEELCWNILNVLENKEDYSLKIKNNQKMILDKYNYGYIYNRLKNMFLKL